MAAIDYFKVSMILGEIFILLAIAFFVIMAAYGQ